MIRAVFMSGRWLGVLIPSAEADEENTTLFADEGNPVLLVEDVEMAEGLGIEIEMA